MTPLAAEIWAAAKTSEQSAKTILNCREQAKALIEHTVEPVDGDQDRETLLS